MKSVPMSLFTGTAQLSHGCATEIVAQALIESVIEDGAGHYTQSLDDDTVVIVIDGCWCGETLGCIRKLLAEELGRKGQVVVATECMCDEAKKVAFAKAVGANCIIERRKDAPQGWSGIFYRPNDNGEWESQFAAEQRYILSGKR